MRRAYFAMTALFAIGMFTPLMISGVSKKLFFEYWPNPGPFMYLNVFFFVFVVLQSLVLLVRHYFQSTGDAKRQALLVLTAYVIGFGGGGTNWFLWYDIPIAPATNFFVSVCFAIFAYAIVRYGLMDLDIFIEILRSNRSHNLGLMVSSIHHEIRNPLYIIRSLAETYEANMQRQYYESDKLAVENARTTLNKTGSQAQRAMEIMKRFALFVKPKNREGDSRGFAAPKEVLNNVLIFVNHELDLQKVECRILLEDGQAVRCHDRDLEDILLNLILNAVQAITASERAGLIQISGNPFQDCFQIKIHDNGPGIEPSEIGKIFEPFVTTKKDGTGLGLYITKLLVERNGGKIAVASRPGEGTTFTLTFPIAERPGL